jgi:hypothetical protein
LTVKLLAIVSAPITPLMNDINKLFEIYEKFVHLSYFLNIDRADLANCMTDRKYKKVSVELRLLIEDYLKKVN